MNIATAIIALAAAYLLGSIPAAYITGRLCRGIDIRQAGSRNMGAMNVFYKVGFVAGLVVLAIDIGKGMAAVALAGWMGVPLIVQMLAGAAAVLGHMFPDWLRFRGGTGGASCIGVLAYFIPWGIPAYGALFALMLVLTRFPTLSYSAAFLAYPLAAWLVYHRWELAVYSVCLLLIPLVRYIPRVYEMRRKGGSWRHVFLRRSLKDRL